MLHPELNLNLCWMAGSVQAACAVRTLLCLPACTHMCKCLVHLRLLKPSVPQSTCHLVAFRRHYPLSSPPVHNTFLSLSAMVNTVQTPSAVETQTPWILAAPRSGHRSTGSTKGVVDPGRAPTNL